MPAYDLGSLSVGSVLTTREFTVRPADLTAHVESSFMGQVIGCGEEVLTTGTIISSVPSPWGRVCPLPVAIGRVLAVLERCEPLRDASVVLRSMSRVRRLGDVMVGEPLTATATVRFRSGRVPGSTHVTLSVEVHRGGQGVHAGATALSFEAGLELHPAEALAGGAAAA